MDTSLDSIVLTLPFRAEYVSVGRLTTSGVASRMGFDIETIEDIKVAVAEVCNKLVEAGSKIENEYSIRFKISGNRLTIIFDCRDKALKCIFSGDDNELGISIITALMDSVEFCPDDSYLLSMSKTVERNF